MTEPATATATAATPRTGLGPPLVVLGAAQFLMVLDTAVMNVSISQLVRDFDTDVTTVQAAITLFSLVMAALMIAGAKLGDRWGRRQAFTIGMVVYGCGSLLTALAPTVGVLMLGWSLLEGAGAALVLPALAALVATTYDGAARASAYAVMGGLAGAGVAVGPLLGGWVTDVASWRYVFAGEVVVVLAIVAAVRLIPPTPAPAGSPRFDLPGVALSATGIALVVLAVLQAGTWGWLTPRNSPVEPLGYALTPFVLAAGVVTLYGFARWERRRTDRGEDPLVRLELLRVPMLRSGLVTTLAQNLVLLGLFFTIPVYLQIVLGLDAFDTGLRLLPISVMMLVCAVCGPPLARALGPRAVVRAGFVAVLGAAVLLLGVVDAPETGAAFLTAMAVLGAGVGLIASQIGNVVQNAVGEQERSEAGGLQFTAQNLGGSLGTALIGTILVGALAGSAAASVAGDSRISQELRAKVGISIEAGVSLIPADELEQALTAAGVGPTETEALVEDYTAAQYAGLRAAYLVVAGLALGALLVTGGLPGRAQAAAPGEARPAAAG